MYAVDDKENVQIGRTATTDKVLARLDSLGIKYDVLEHGLVRTSNPEDGERAERLEQGANSLIFKTEKGEFVNAIVSAAVRIDNNKLRKLIGSRKLRFANDDELFDITGCKSGAVPPFGNLFGLRVFMEDFLQTEEEVYFNVGSHTMSLRMKRADLERATGALVANFRT